mgnify:FL=1
MSFMLFISIIFLIAISLMMIFGFIYSVYKYVIIKFKAKNTELSVSELFSSIGIVINNEISLSERNLLDNKGSVLTNTTYDTYYKDLTTNIINALSDDIVERLSFYITREALYKMISREVQIYLNSKIE